MQFTTTVLTSLALVAPSLADGIFAITGTGSTNGTLVSLTVQNGNVGDAPKCSGSFTGPVFPTSGTIPCVDGYALSYTWASTSEGLAATYTSPGNTFTYNVPNNGCDASTCQLGFTDLFPSRKIRSFKA